MTNARHKIPITSQIEEMVCEIPGWSSIDQLFALFNLVYLTSDLDGDVVEIGTWCGRSAAVLGLAARLTGKSKVVCIDLFPERDDWKQNADGSYSIEMTINDKKYVACHIQTTWKEPFERDIAPLYAKRGGVLKIFTETMIKNKLTDVVIPYRGTSELLKTPDFQNFKCKVAFLDGDHSYEALCEDIKNVESVLVSGGWICFDDAFSSYDGINRAITERIMDNPQYDRCQQITRKFFIARRTDRPRAVLKN